MTIVYDTDVSIELDAYPITADSANIVDILSTDNREKRIQYLYKQYVDNVATCIIVKDLTIAVELKRLGANVLYEL